MDTCTEKHARMCSCTGAPALPIENRRCTRATGVQGVWLETRQRMDVTVRWTCDCRRAAGHELQLYAIAQAANPAVTDRHVWQSPLRYYWQRVGWVRRGVSGTDGKGRVHAKLEQCLTASSIKYNEYSTGERSHVFKLLLNTHYKSVRPNTWLPRS